MVNILRNFEGWGPTEVAYKKKVYYYKYHNIPDEVVSLVTSLYADCVVSISNDKFTTNPIAVNILQGDSLSPLLFNLIVNTLMQTIKNKKN